MTSLKVPQRQTIEVPLKYHHYNVQERWNFEKFTGINLHRTTVMSLAALVNDPQNFINIHNWLLQPFSQDYWPCFSHHFMLWVLILYISRLRTTDFFWDAFHGQFYLYTHSFCQKSVERKSLKSLFVFCFNVCLGARTLALLTER